MNATTETVVEEVAATDAVATKPAKAKAKVSKTKAKTGPAQKAKAKAKIAADKAKAKAKLDAAKAKEKAKAEKEAQKAKDLVIAEKAKEKALVVANKHVEKLVGDLTKTQLKLKTVGIDMITLAIESGHTLLDLKTEVKDNIGHQWKSWCEEGYVAGTFPTSYKQVSKYMKLAAKADEVQQIVDDKAAKGEFLSIDEVYAMLSASYNEEEAEAKKLETKEKAEATSLQVEALEGRFPGTILSTHVGLTFAELVAGVESVGDLEAVINICQNQIDKLGRIPSTPTALAEDDTVDAELDSDVDDIAAEMEGKTDPDFI